MSAVATTRLGCEFDRFLYAAVGEDNNGMPLTLLSALARMDVDPWEEASKLTQLPQEHAVTQLAHLLGALRHACPVSADPARIAAPLIALLPRPRPAVPLITALAQAAQTKHPVAVSTLLSIWVYLIFMLFGHWLLGSIQAPRPMQAPPTSGATSDSPIAPIPSAGLPKLIK